MKVTGSVVKRLDDHKILVEIVRTSACGGNCHSCGSCSGSQSQITARCTEEVNAGDQVMIELSSHQYFLLSFLVFLLPLFVIVAGYVLFAKFFGETASSFGAVLLGILVFLAVVIGMRRLKIPKAKKI